MGILRHSIEFCSPFDPYPVKYLILLMLITRTLAEMHYFSKLCSNSTVDCLKMKIDSWVVLRWNSAQPFAWARISSIVDLYQLHLLLNKEGSTLVLLDSLAAFAITPHATLNERVAMIKLRERALTQCKYLFF